MLRALPRIWTGIGLLALGVALGAIPAEEEGFTTLFDGKTLSGWTPVAGKAGNWEVKDGVLITKGEGGGWLSTDAMYSDFVFKLEYRYKKGGNSGVFIRSPRTGDPAYTGMEIQILDDDDAQYKDLKAYQYMGSVYGVSAAKRGGSLGPDKWQEMEIRAEGSKIKVTLNGKPVTEADLQEHKDAEAQHPGILRKEGYIGLQSHSEPVEFRNIRIKVLKK